jgi:hypothetical protein
MLKIKTFIAMLKSSKKLRLFLLIDIVFYFYAIFGFMIMSSIFAKTSVSVMTVVAIWSLLFMVIIILKMYKEIVKQKEKMIYD